MQTSHVALNLAIPEVVGVSVISVQVVVDSQSSNVIQIPVQPPAISLIDITDTSDYVSDFCRVCIISLKSHHGILVVTVADAGPVCC